MIETYVERLIHDILISYAIRSPSRYNSQPWCFQVVGNEITIVPDLEKQLKVVDSTNKELFISLGCVLENLQIASFHHCYLTEYNISRDDKIHVKLIKKNSDVSISEEDELLFSAINYRRTNIGKFKSKKITKEQKKYIEREKNNSIFVYDSNSEEANIICRSIIEGIRIQMADSDFMSEWSKWKIVNKNQKKNRRVRVVREKPLLRKTKMFITNSLGIRSSYEKKQKKINDSTSYFCVFTMKKYDVKEYIEVGKVLEHFILKITSMGLSYSFCNQPCEVTKVLNKLKEDLQLIDIPVVIIRVGKGSKKSGLSPKETPMVSHCNSIL